jgi:hypothetical protein
MSGANLVNLAPDIALPARIMGMGFEQVHVQNMSRTSSSPWWMWVGLAVVIVGAIAWFWYKGAKRDKALKDFHGIQVQWQQGGPDDRLWSRSTFPHDAINRQVRDNWNANVRGFWCTSWEVYYQTESKDDKGHIHRHNHDYRLITIDLPVPRPRLNIKPETALTRMRKDMDFESIQFNNTFEVQAENKQFAYAVLHSRTILWMLADNRSRYYGIDFCGPYVNIRSIDGSEFEANMMADYLVELLVRTPQQAWAS